MKRVCVLAVLAALSISLAAQDDATPQTSESQAASAQPAPNKPDNVIKGSFPVQLEKTLNSSKLKEGDTIVYKTVTAIHSRSGLMIPSGAKIIGHVTRAQARLKGDAESMLAIEFDKIEYGKGEEIPMKGTLQAVGPTLGEPHPDTGAGPHELAVASHGGVASGTNLNVDLPPPAHGGSNPPSTGSMQTSGPSSGTPILRPDSQGVLGVKNLQMSSNGALTSAGKEVKLDSGMQVMIRAEIELPSR